MANTNASPDSDPTLGLAVGFLELDRARVVLDVNGMGECWLGRPRSGLIGRTISEIDEAPWGRGMLSLLLDSVDLEDRNIEIRPPDFFLGRGSRACSLKGHSNRNKAGYVIEIHDITSEQRLRAVIERIIGPEVLAEILRTQDEGRVGDLLRPTRIEVTVLFADLRGFTRLCAELEPGRVKAILDDFLGATTEVVRAAGGTVDKFVGDGVMALFGAPVAQADHSLRAFRAAVDILRAHPGRRASWAGPDLAQGPDLGAGLCAGPVVYGGLGAGTIVSCTAIGTPVNVASRLCGEAAGGELVLPREFYDAVAPQLRADAARFSGLNMKPDCLALKNLPEPVPVVRMRFGART